MAETAPLVPDSAEEHVREMMEPNQPDPAGAVRVPTKPKEVSADPAPDAETDKAVEEITKKDGDEALAAQDNAAGKPYVMKPKLRERMGNAWVAWWGNPKKRYGTLAGLVIIIGLLAVIPFTRYELLGLFLKKQASVVVVDSKTGDPVSGAVVKIGGTQAKTEASGKAVLRAKLGKVTIVVSKKYYKSATQSSTVTLSEQNNRFNVSVLALGRSVPIKLVNKINGKPLVGALLTVQGGETKTDKNGLATVVLSSSDSSQKAKLSLNGYNTSNVTIQAVDGVVAANTFDLVPSGKLYFLSNQSGKIDVVKTNLDGSDRQTVLAGTGNEDPNSTSLLAARDWKYLALLAKRDTGSNASIYLIDTTDSDKLTTIDQGNVNFNLVGWSNDTFVYQVNRNGVESWQSKAQALKSYDATSGKSTLLDETTAEGTSSYDYGNTGYSSVYLLDNEIVYAKNWFTNYMGTHLIGKTDSLISIRPDGTGHKTIKDFPVPAGSNYYSINLNLYQPYGIYVQASASTGNTYYEYEDGSLTPKPAITDTAFNSPYATYLISPSANYTFWTELRDGKNTLFVGDKNGASPKQIASAADYKPYGWYSDDYLLVSKSSSELYIMPRDGSSAPLKMTDYYKPPVSYNGYGGGYGGL